MSFRHWAVPLLLCLTSVALGQQGRPELSQRPATNAEVAQGKIRIDVVVTDASGKPVGGLRQQDFTLLDDKKPQPILSFRAVDGAAGESAAGEPVEVILLIDVTNNHLHNVAYERYQIDKFLKQNGGRLAQPTTLMIFSDQGVQVQPRPMTDGNALAQIFDKTNMPVHMIPLTGGYEAIQRVEKSLRTLQEIAEVEAQKPGRKLLLWIGQGWPMLEGPGYQQSDRSQRSGFNGIVAITQLLRDARITLYSINAFDPGSAEQIRADFYKSFLKPVKLPHDLESGDLSVPVFAIHSGGKVYNTAGDLAALIESCVAEARPYYTIGFDPAAAERTDEYHSIEVRVAKPGLTARTWAGYYAEPGLKP